MKKDSNRRFAAFITAAMVMGMIQPYSYAESETNSVKDVYFDLTPYKNARVFSDIPVTDKSFEWDAKKYPNNGGQSIDDGDSVVFMQAPFKAAIDNEGFITTKQASKFITPTAQNHKINPEPSEEIAQAEKFMVNVDYNKDGKAALMLGCNGQASETIDIDDGYYDKISVLGFNQRQPLSKHMQDADKGFYVSATINYADGTTSEDDTLYVQKADANIDTIYYGEDSAVIKKTNGELEGEYVSPAIGDSTGIAWHYADSQLYVPTFDVDIQYPGKLVDSITFTAYTQGANYGFVVLGMTGKSQNEKALEDLVSVNVSEINLTNINRYKKLIGVIDALIADGTVLTTEQNAKYSEINRIFYKLENKYKYVDLSAYKNGYIFTDKSEGDTLEKYELKDGLTINSSYCADTMILRSKAFESKMVDGFISDNDGMKYKMDMSVNSNGYTGLLMGSNGIASQKIDVEDGYYESFKAIGFQQRNKGYIPNNNNFKMTATITYTDGTTSTDDTILLYKPSTQASEVSSTYIPFESVNKDTAPILNVGENKTLSRWTGQNINFYIPTFTVKTDSTKKVAYITFDNTCTSTHFGITIIGMTGICEDDETVFNALFNKLQSTDVDRSNYLNVKMLLNDWKEISQRSMIEFNEEQQDVYARLLRDVARFEEKYKYVDLTSYKNARVFSDVLVTNESFTWDAKEYPNNTGSANLGDADTVVLMQTPFKNIIDNDGFITTVSHTKFNIPKNVNHQINPQPEEKLSESVKFRVNVDYNENNDAALMLGCNGQSSATIDVENGYYDKVTVLGFNQRQPLSRYMQGGEKNFYVSATINYADGTTSTDDTLYIQKADANIELIYYGEDYANVKSVDSIYPAVKDTSGNAWAYCTSELYVPTFDVNIEYSEKVVDSITFTAHTQGANFGFVVLGMTGISADIDSQLAKIADQLAKFKDNKISIANAYDFIVLDSLAQEYEKFFTAAQKEKYVSLKEAYNEYETALQTNKYVDIYVGPAGNDANPATAEQPLKTIEKALEIVKNHRSYIADGISINIRLLSGKHIISETIDLGKEHGGSSVAKVSIIGEDGAVISQGKDLSDRQFTEVATDSEAYTRLPQEAKGNVLEMDLSDIAAELPDLNKILTAFHESTQKSGWTERSFNSITSYIDLKVNGKRQTRAQYPNNGYIAITSPVEDSGPASNNINTKGNESGIGTFTYNEERGDRWASAIEHENDLFAIGYWWEDYNRDTVKIQSVNTVEKKLSVDTRTRTSGGIFYNGTKSGGADARRYKIINALEELDAPGEWYYSPSYKKLYYYPENSDSISSIMLVYDKKHDDVLENAYEENAIFNIHDTSYITVKNVSLQDCAGNGINIKDSANITVDGCEISDIYKKAMDVRNTKKLTVTNCDIYDCEYGIRIDGGDFDTLTPSENVISYNKIHDIGTDIGTDFSSTYNHGIYVSDVGYNIEHNELYNLPGFAVSANGNDATVRYNYIHDVCYDTNDVGAIYSLEKNGLYRGYDISYNLIRNVRSYWNLADGYDEKDYYNIYDTPNAIYMDAGTSGVNIHHNIIDNAGVGTYLNHPQDTKVCNNIYVNTTQMRFTSSDKVITEIAESRTKEYNSLTEEQKTLYTKKYSLDVETLLSGVPTNVSFDGNLFVKDGDDTKIDTYTNVFFGKNNNTNTNNKFIKLDGFTGFVNFAAGDLRLKNDAQVLTKISGLSSLAENDVDYSSFGGADKAKAFKDVNADSLTVLADGRYQTSLKGLQGKTVTLNVKYANDNRSNTMIFALYDGDKLISVTTNPMSMQFEKIEKSFNIAVPSDVSDNAELKVMFWNNLSGAKPLDNALKY